MPPAVVFQSLLGLRLQLVLDKWCEHVATMALCLLRVGRPFASRAEMSCAIQLGPVDVCSTRQLNESVCCRHAEGS